MQNPQVAQRARELERKYQNRRGHAAQLSISDDSHHITEAIGDMYGDHEFTTRRESRPLSFISSPNGESFESLHMNNGRGPLLRTNSVPLVGHGGHGHGHSINSPNSPTSPSMQRNASPLSPSHLHRSNSDTAQQPFPLNDIDYESSPAAVAQELSNLQAIRRMSMDVNASDPDLPSFSSGFAMPSMAPSHSSDEDDASRLFWVPARLHPELAPTEFKTFIEDRVQKIRRRSGSEEILPTDGVGRSSSAGGLRRKKSMLSRQVQDGSSYRDGADRLERKRSGAAPEGRPNQLENIEELEHLVNDPSNVMRRLSLESMRKSIDSAIEVPPDEDMPILPPKPAGQTLKRSTRTNYRRGSLRKGERVPFTRRLPRQSETESEDSEATSPTVAGFGDMQPQFGLTRVQTEPLPRGRPLPENFSRPTRKRTPPLPSEADEHPSAEPGSPPESEMRRSPQPKPFHSRIASNGRTTAQLPGISPSQSIPQIIETPPPGEGASKSGPTYFQPPARSSSHAIPPQFSNERPPPSAPLPNRPPPVNKPTPPPPRPPPPPAAPDQQTLHDLVSHPTPLPGNQSTRTDHLSTIPFEDKKQDKKQKEKKEGSEGGRKGWWFLGGDDKDKDKKEKDERESMKKSKSKTKSSEKLHDNTRLDVLQASIDGGRPRESLVLDRETVKLEEERKKESNRKSSDNKKEKDTGIFSSLFGGSKKKGDRDSGGKKSGRGLSPEPPPRILKPDIDYNWTRFSILQERTIYRMAHIKLANPRRELYSQVLLSNFMYSYLAKVQQMHPQIQIAQTPAQKQQVQRQMQQQQPKKEQQQQQPDEFTQYQQFQEQQRLAENQNSANSGEAPSDGDDLHRVDSRGSSHNHYMGQPNGNTYQSAGGQNYHVQQDNKHQQHQPYYQQSLFEDSEPTRDDDMW